MVGLFALVKYLPELIALIKALEAAALEAETKRKVADDITTITSAFKSKDASALNALFNSK